MASKAVWDNYNDPNSNNKGTDEDILSMISDVVDAINLMEKMYGKRSELITRSLMQDWRSLCLIDYARDLKDHKRPSMRVDNQLKTPVKRKNK